MEVHQKQISGPGYYALQILKAANLTGITTHLYVEARIKGKAQRTQTIKTVLSSWCETLPICVSSGKDAISLSLFHLERTLPWNQCVGVCNTTLSDLAMQCGTGRGKAMLHIMKSQKVTGTLHVKLLDSSVQENALIALRNLLKLLDDHDDEKSHETDIGGSTRERIDQLIEEGKTIIQSGLGGSATNIYPGLNSVVDFVDKLAKAHPLLDVGWQLLAAMYRVASEQDNLNREVENLLSSLLSAFVFIEDADQLASAPNTLPSLQRTISSLVDQLIDCSLFIATYVRTKTLNRIFRQANERKRINDIISSISQLRNGLRDGFFKQMTFYMGCIANSALDGSTLKDIREELGLTSDILEDIESSKYSICMENTRKEYIDEISAWLRSGTKQNVFWLRGIPGSGKSTIAQTVARHSEISPSLVSHICFRRENIRHYNIFQLIAYRLAVTNTKLAQRILVGARKPRLSLQDTFKNLILDPLIETKDSAVLSGTFIIILDALDEYGNGEAREPLLHLLGDDFASLPPNVRFLVTSRPEDDIFRALASHDHILVRELEHNSESSKHDVFLYLQTAMNKLVPQSTILSDEAWDRKIAKFAEAADGLFIWASVATRLIKRSTTPYAKICALADNEALLSLDSLYMQVLQTADIDWSDADTRQTFKHILTFVLSGNWTVTIHTIDMVLGLGGDSSKTLLSKLQSVLSVDEKVQLYHKTFADFLQNRAHADNSWYIDIPIDSLFIVKRLFTILELLHYNISGSLTSTSRTTHVDLPVHVRYAILHWDEHLFDAEFSEELHYLLHRFLSEHLLFWFEILSQLREFHRIAAPALRNALQWVKNKPDTLDTIKLIIDAASIMSRFYAGIADDPKFLYAVALPLTTKANNVSKQFTKLMTGPMCIAKIDSDADMQVHSSVQPARPFSGYLGAIYTIAFTPDMHRIVTGSSNATIQVWDSNTGGSIGGPFVGHTGAVTSLDISLDGQVIVSGSGDGTIRRWDMKAHAAIGDPLVGHSKEVLAIAISPDGQMVASGSADHLVRLWEMNSGESIGGPLEGHTGEVNTVAFSPDGQKLISGADDAVVRVWEVATRKACSEVLRGHSSIVNAAIFSRDGQWIASCSDDCTIRIWDAVTLEPIGHPMQGHTDWVNAIGFYPDGRRLVSGSSDRTVRIWDVETSEQIGMPLVGHSEYVCCVAVSPDGTSIVSGDGEGDAIVWDAKTGEVLHGADIERGGKARSEENDDGPRHEEEREPTGNQGGEDFAIEEHQFFASWRLVDGWLMSENGERRLWLPSDLRRLVKQNDEGVYVHQELDLANCNGAAEGNKGFIVSE